jgi:hypothetical protein
LIHSRLFLFFPLWFVSCSIRFSHESFACQLGVLKHIFPSLVLFLFLA